MSDDELLRFGMVAKYMRSQGEQLDKEKLKAFTLQLDEARKVTPRAPEQAMPIKVLLADDSDVIRSAIRKTLSEESRIEVVGEASCFATTIQMIATLKPDVLLLDLHLPEKRDFTPAFVKSRLVYVRHTVAVSLSNDDDAKALAKSYGAGFRMADFAAFALKVATLWGRREELEKALVKLEVRRQN